MNELLLKLKTEIENSYFPKEKLLSSSTRDGRLDSAESKVVISNFIEKILCSYDLDVFQGKKRGWYDLAFTHNNMFYPIKITITDGKNADNIGSKNGLFFTLTGLNPDVLQGVKRWKTFNETLVKYLNYNTDADYYFIVYFKEEERFLLTSLKCLKTLTPNGNNLPFQCSWSANKEFSNRTKEEQINYLMQTYLISWRLKIEGIEPLLRWGELVE